MTTIAPSSSRWTPFRRLDPSRAVQLVMYFTAAVLIASGLAHFVLWIASSAPPLAGDISLRKPILFGFSAGATVLSLGWLVGKLPSRSSDRIVLSAFSAAMLLEVGLITLQQWRGVPSHFNRSTVLDARILLGIEALITFVTIVIADLTVRSFGRLNTPQDMRLALRGGMSLLLLSCVLGFVIVFLGGQRQVAGEAPGTYGAAGVLKFPHGMPMHAIQFIPLTLWALRKLRVPLQDRYRAAAFMLVSICIFTVYSLAQTFAGRGRFDLTWPSTVILALAILAAITPGWLLLRTRRTG